MNRKCIYLVEGECEEKLIKALKEKPSLLIPGKVKRFNVIQNELKTSHLVTFAPGSLVVLVFDTDKALGADAARFLSFYCSRRCGIEKVISESYHSSSHSIAEQALTRKHDSDEGSCFLFSNGNPSVGKHNTPYYTNINLCMLPPDVKSPFFLALS